MAEQIGGYPVIVRPAFTLGGGGGGVANSPEELKVIAATGLDASPITQILVEQCHPRLEGDRVRDHAGRRGQRHRCVLHGKRGPRGRPHRRLHRGGPGTLTLSDKEYQMLRSASLDIISALGIVGGCNCQFALNPDSFEYAVIEVNPRVSRSSALASKATGYPIAKITTKIALGYTLDEIANDITGKTCACFEPTLDYVVVKFPKWPFDKFADASRTLGTQMKATGEVMAIAPSFEMAADEGRPGCGDLHGYPQPQTGPGRTRRLCPSGCGGWTTMRLFTVFEALKAGMSVDEIYDITSIDRWFLWQAPGPGRV